MEKHYPSYYGEFRCAAAACPDSCCHEWDVQVDEASAARFQAMEGPLGDALRTHLYREEGDYYLRNIDGRCPMWREDGLCRIQAERGHEALCQVCQQFPRLTQDYGTFVEYGIEMSCPEAARIMLTAADWRLCTQTAEGGEEPDYDEELMDLLRESRPGAFELLKDQSRTVNQRLALLLMYGYHIQARIDGADPAPFDQEAALAEAAQFAGAGDGGALAAFYGDLEILTRRWSGLLARRGTPRWDEELCKLAQYAVYRYYYQAVSDWDLTGRIKMIVAGCILCAMLPGNRVEAIQLYAKEIENSAENVDALLDGAYTQPALTDANLLGLLR